MARPRGSIGEKEVFRDSRHPLNSLNVNLSTIRVPQEFRDKAVDLINGFRSTQWHHNVSPDKDFVERENSQQRDETMMI